MTDGEFICECINILSAVNPVDAPNNGAEPSNDPIKQIKTCAKNAFGVSTVAGAGAVAAGTNALTTAGKFAGATPGTSVASSFFRSILPQAVESTWAPTLMNPLATSGVFGGVVGRWVPIVGEGLLIKSGAQFTACLWASGTDPI